MGDSVEVVPFGWQSTANRLKRSGANPVLRLRDNGQPFVTDGGHYILSCAYGPIADPAGLQAKLKDSIVGVVEHGLFLGMAWEALIGGASGVTTLRRA